MKIFFRNFQNSLDNDILQIQQDKLSEIQFIKINNIVKNNQQDNKNYHDTKTLLYDWKAWHAVITTNKNMIKQIYKNCDHLIIKSDLNNLKKWEQCNNITVIEYVRHLSQNVTQETCICHKKKENIQIIDELNIFFHNKQKNHIDF